MDPIVETKNLTYSYGDQPAVEDVTMTVAAGDFLGLIGPNGSGKTTLLHLMLGLLTPDSGQVRLFDTPIEIFDRGERIGYVAQESSNRGRTMPVTVKECVTMGRFAHVGNGRLSREDRSIVDHAIETVDIGELVDRRMSRLSGGQRQRAFIARALASEADLLALDEPTIGVDAESREDFYQLLEELNESGITIILIEHDIGVVTARANKIACINKNLFHYGDTESFVESDALSRAYGETVQVVHHHH